MIGEESMTNIAEMIANFKVLGAQLMESIGPTVLSIGEGLVSFTESLHESKMLLPALKGLLAFIAIKSLVSAIASIYTSFSQIPFGIGIPLAIASVVGLKAAISGLPSFAGLESGKTAMIQSGAAVAHAGENITRTEDMRAINKPAEEKLDKLVNIMDSAFGFGGTAAKQIGSQVGSRLENIG